MYTLTNRKKNSFFINLTVVDMIYGPGYMIIYPGFFFPHKLIFVFKILILEKYFLRSKMVQRIVKKNFQSSSISKFDL